MYWFLIYYYHYIKALGIIAFSYDPCLLCTPGVINERKSGLKGITCLQTDDITNAGNDAFARLESKIFIHFQGKPVETLIYEGLIRFNGAFIEL